MANLITCIRIVCSIALLFCPVFSPAFYALYIAAGVTDMIDGAVARKTGTVSEFGAKLDTTADFVLVVVCLIKLLPVLHVPAGTTTVPPPFLQQASIASLKDCLFCCMSFSRAP